ncbi:Beta-hexosaminidase [Nymphon striatum]|nr:Beta-hexosaminidase [Nymphon striatum]
MYRILIDQEGGRVRRLRPPHWEAYPAGEVFGEHYHQDKKRALRFAWLQSRLMACDLQKLGINVDCLPVLDVPVRGSHDVIGDRAYGTEPVIVSDIGLAASEGLLSGGVLPVIKHIPGHGRAGVDSHKDLPVVTATISELERSDFEPFRRLNEMPLAMTAHVVYTAIDADNPATTSKRVIKDIIRDYIGFDGLLMCDDLSMHALKGSFEERTTASFDAGCDVVLHCNGDLNEMRPIAAASPKLSGDSLRRAVQATDLFASVKACDEDDLRSEFRTLCDGNEKDLVSIAQGSDVADVWDNSEKEILSTEPQLKVDVEGFEGPLDLLLELSRRQKVDLSKISILALAEQYLEFVEEVRKLRIELAADYLVMAAWLAFLKSKLLLPVEDSSDDEMSGEEMAAQLAFRLKRLEAMREAGKRLVNRNRLGRDFFRTRHSGTHSN